MAEPLLRTVRAFCQQEALLQPGQHIVCAVSGGADSMALLTLLRELEPTLRISAAHFNHQLRGAESDRDEAFVRDFCAAQGIPLRVGRGDVAACAAQSGQTVEEAARTLRYAFLDTLEGDCIATAHHADDNAETVLLHLLRGSGLRGLCGIPPRRGRIIRPLLPCTRQELRAFLRARGIDWVEDSSNQSDAAMRNRLRHHALPAFQTLAPTLSRQLCAQSALLREDERYLQTQAAQLLAQAREPDGSLHVPVLTAAPPALQNRALRLWLADVLPQNLTQAHVRALRMLLESPQPAARCTLPGGLTICRRYDRLCPDHGGAGGFLPVAVSPGACVVTLPELGLRVRGIPVENSEKIPNSPFHFAIRYDIIQKDGFLIRSRMPGDRIATPGGHHTSLKKLLIDRRIPRDERARMPVLAAGDFVLAVAGLGANPDALPAAGQPALVLTIEKTEDAAPAAPSSKRGES